MRLFDPKAPVSTIQNATAPKQSKAKDPLTALRNKKARDLAISPLKSLPMNMFMMWMAGNGVQIFSVMITAMMFFNPVKAVMSISDAFKPFEGTSDIKVNKMLFVACQCAAVALGVWKCQQMGLIPSTSSDFLSFMEPKVIQELAK